MKIKLNHFWNWIMRHKVWSIIIILIIAGVLFFVMRGGKNDQEITSVTAQIGTIREEVSVTGNVEPLSNVDLAFERGGRVSSLPIAVGQKVYAGQYLASVSNADLSASLDQAKANLKKVQAQSGSDAETTALDFSQSQISLTSAIKDSYTKADDALRNKIYSLFTDPVKYRAKLSFTTDTFLQEDIEDGKDDLSDDLDIWDRALRTFTNTSDLESNYQLAKANLNSTKSLLDKCATAVNGLSSESSGITQTQIDTYKLNISTARTNINTAIDTLTSSYDQYKTASLAVKISKNSTLAEEASIEQAQAQVASAEAELAKSIIRSPLTGVITKIDAKLGEIVPASQTVISIISYGDYEIKTFVPEADISKVKIGNLARTTLDAYGEGVVFETQVIKVDPAATVIDGVPTYEVTLKFINQDARVKSGMTANLDILTAEKLDVLVVPARAVYSKSGGKFVKTLLADGSITEVEVSVGLRGIDGNVEIISGLTAGDKVVTSL